MRPEFSSQKSAREVSLTMIASLALLSFVGFLGFASSQSKPSQAMKAAETAFFAEKGTDEITALKGIKENGPADHSRAGGGGPLGQMLGETTPHVSDCPGWEAHCGNTCCWLDTDTVPGPQNEEEDFDVMEASLADAMVGVGAETAPVDEVALAKYMTEKHEWDTGAVKEPVFHQEEATQAVHVPETVNEWQMQGQETPIEAHCVWEPSCGFNCCWLNQDEVAGPEQANNVSPYEYEFQGSLPEDASPEMVARETAPVSEEALAQFQRQEEAQMAAHACPNYPYCDEDNGKDVKSEQRPPTNRCPPIC